MVFTTSTNQYVTEQQFREEQMRREYEAMAMQQNRQLGYKDPWGDEEEIRKMQRASEAKKHETLLLIDEV